MAFGTRCGAARTCLSADAVVPPRGSSAASADTVRSGPNSVRRCAMREVPLARQGTCRGGPHWFRENRHCRLWSVRTLARASRAQVCACKPQSYYLQTVAAVVAHTSMHSQIFATCVLQCDPSLGRPAVVPIITTQGGVRVKWSGRAAHIGEI